MFKLRKRILVVAILLSFATPAFGWAGSAWRPIGASCPNGTRVNVSASGQVTATFYYWTLFWISSHTTVVDFGGGSSRNIETYFGAAYDGVSVSGSNLFSVGNAGCR